jgi:hypothetical protein
MPGGQIGGRRKSSGGKSGRKTLAGKKCKMKCVATNVAQDTYLSNKESVSNDRALDDFYRQIHLVLMKRLAYEITLATALNICYEGVFYTLLDGLVYDDDLYEVGTFKDGIFTRTTPY